MKLIQDPDPVLYQEVENTAIGSPVLQYVHDRCHRVLKMLI